MRLAALMHCTLDELGERMSAEEFGLWSTFLQHEPMGPAALADALAEVIAALANGPLKPPRGRKTWRAADFMPELWVAPPPGEAPSQDGPSMEQIKQFFGG